MSHPNIIAINVGNTRTQVGAFVDGKLTASERFQNQPPAFPVAAVEWIVAKWGEIAPRPHNSGHYTLDACVCSQFEQQVRAICGLPLGSTEALKPSVMINILGDAWFDHGQLRAPDWAGVLRVPGAKVHLYGKAEARLGRKMGHVTAINGSIDAALSRANEVARLLGIAPAH